MTTDAYQAKNNTLGIYVHIPFCARKCDYCDFYSLVGHTAEMDAYLQALTRHILTSAKKANDYTVDTIYFGGGTPSFFGAARIADVLACIKNAYQVTDGCEITVECNPDSASEALLGTLYAAGVNRLSMGVQSAQDEELAHIGRLHSFSQAQQAVSRARKAGFDNISLDLIYGLPGQSMESWRISVEAILALQPEHLSCYALKLEEGTPLYERREQEALVDDDLQADMYLWMVERLEKAGLNQYEISNFARGNRRSRHNLKYWTLGNYMGFGPSAHSCLNGVRYAYISDLRGYISSVMQGNEPICESKAIETKERAEEYLMLRMRTTLGLSAQEYQTNVDADFSAIEKALLEFQGHGWCCCEDNRWRFTPEGFLLSTPLIAALLEAQEESTR